MESRRTRPVIGAWPTTSGADLPGDRNERRRSDLPERGAVPVRKRIEAADPSRRQGDNRLKDNADLRFGDRPTRGVLRRGGGEGEEGEAAGAGELDVEPVDGERRCEDRLDLVSERNRLGPRADPVAKDGELVAAHPGGRAASLHRPGEPARDLPEDVVSGRMSVDVVDRLESVE